MKRTLAFLLVAAMLLGMVSTLPAPAWAASIVDQGRDYGLSWMLDSDGLLTISGYGRMRDYGAVKDPAPWADYYAQIKAVLINEGVTSIGTDAFSGCVNLASVTIANTVTSIGGGAFAYCASLQAIQIPDSVTEIQEFAFSDCTSLASIVIPDGVTTISNGIFSGCTGLTEIQLSNAVTEIGYQAFYNCTGITSIIIPSSVRSLGYEAFYGCTSLSKVVFQGGAPQTQYRTFYGVTAEVHYPKSDPTWSEMVRNSMSNSATLTWVADEDGQKITGTWGGLNWTLDMTNGELTVTGEGAMEEFPTNSSAAWRRYLSYIQSLVIGDGITSICEMAFAYCSELQSVSIPASVTDMGRSAFSGCDKLIQIENGVSYVGRWVIEVESDLTEISLRSDTEGIAAWTFGYNGMTSLALPDSLKVISSHAFYNCRHLTDITIPKAVTSIGYTAFSGCESLTSIVIPDSVTDLGDRAFFDCSGLVRATIGNGVKAIGDEAFYRCTNLTTVILGDGVTSIGVEAFSACEKLSSITLGSSVAAIGEYAFYRCTSLTDISLPDSLTTFGFQAFSRCTGLTEIIIPRNVTTMGQQVFGGCTNLVKITFMGNAPETHLAAFSDLTADAYYPANDSWTEDVRMNFYGEINWIPYSLCDGNHTPAVIEAVAPTCTEPGLSEGSRCSACGEILVAQEEVPATGHSYGQWEVAQAPTCTEPGEQWRHCHCGASERQEIEPTDHPNVHTENDRAPTCTEDGYTGDAVCDDCGLVMDIGRAIPALGHSFVDWVQTQAPTCTEQGSEIRDCARCGALETRPVAALGHTEVVDPAVAATCTESGLTEGKHCAVCGEVLVAQEVIPATGHSHTAVVTAPTCTEGGYTTYTCHCGDSYIGDEVPALGHDYVDGTCNRCGEAEYTLGDVNGDGQLNARDARALLRAIAGLDGDGELDPAIADFNGDGKVNARDARALLRKIAGLE